MRTSDLMIGDWVHSITTTHDVSFPEGGVIQDEGYTTIYSPIKLTTVSENCISYYSNKLKSYITLPIEEVGPIPLTLELLDKNGFERQEAYGHHFAILYCDNQEVCSLCWETNTLVLHSDNCYCKLSKCTYVHELQQLLRLCKIDKEIVV